METNNEAWFIEWRTPATAELNEYTSTAAKLHTTKSLMALEVLTEAGIDTLAGTTATERTQYRRAADALRSKLSERWHDR